MALVLLDGVGSNGTKTAGGFDIANTALTASVTTRTFAEAVADGDLASTDEVIATVKKDETNWQVIRATYTDAATDTLTNVQVLAEYPGTTISTTDAVEIWCTPNADALVPVVREPVISGIVPSWPNDNSLNWSAGHAVVNGQLLEIPATSSGTLAQGDPGLSAVNVWNHYLWDNAGTPEIELSQTVPQKDATHRYWTKGTDPAYRWIGWHRVTDDLGTRRIDRFKCAEAGRILEYRQPRSRMPNNNNYDAANQRLVDVTGLTSDQPFTEITGLANRLAVPVFNCSMRVQMTNQASPSAGYVSLSHADLDTDYGSMPSMETCGETMFSFRQQSNSQFIGFMQMVPRAADGKVFWAFFSSAGNIDLQIEPYGGDAER